MATAPSPNDLTRQQLDELDALLQRMLALPLNPIDTPPPATPAAVPPLPDTATPPPRPKNWRVDLPAPPVGPSPYLRIDPVGDPEPSVPFIPPVAEFQPEPFAARSEPVVLPVVPEPISVPEPVRMPETPPAVIAELPIADPLPEPAPPKVSPSRPVPPFKSRHTAPPPAGFAPFASLDRALHWVLGWLGGPGRFLRSAPGKNLIGLAGLGLLLYTAARVAQIQGWVSLPIVLPWPPG